MSDAADLEEPVVAPVVDEAAAADEEPQSMEEEAPAATEAPTPRQTAHHV